MSLHSASHPRHQLVPPRVENVQFLLDQLVQHASVHQRLCQLPNLVPVVFWVPQQKLQTLGTQTLVGIEGCAIRSKK